MAGVLTCPRAPISGLLSTVACSAGAQDELDVKLCLQAVNSAMRALLLSCQDLGQQLCP